MKQSIRARRARMNWGEEDKSTGVDMEMFGRAQRYKSNIKETMLCNYFKDTSYSAILWESMGATIKHTANGQSPIPSINEYIGVLRQGLELIKANAVDGLSLVEARVVVTDMNPAVEELELNRLNGVFSTNEAELNNVLRDSIEHTEENDEQLNRILNELQELNRSYYETIVDIRKKINDHLLLID